jgi:hypothetical protein
MRYIRQIIDISLMRMVIYKSDWYFICNLFLWYAKAHLFYWIFQFKISDIREFSRLRIMMKEYRNLIAGGYSCCINISMSPLLSNSHIFLCFLILNIIFLSEQLVTLALGVSNRSWIQHKTWEMIRFANISPAECTILVLNAIFFYIVLPDFIELPNKIISF